MDWSVIAAQLNVTDLLVTLGVMAGLMVLPYAAAWGARVLASMFGAADEPEEEATDRDDERDDGHEQDSRL